MTGNPLLGLFQRLFNPESLGYFLKVFAPFLFLPFFHIPTLFLTFPILFQNLLSSSGGMRSFNYHYLTGLTPFLFIATIYAIRSLRDKSIRFNRYLGWVGMLLLFTAVARSGPSEYYFYWQSHDHQSEHLGLVREKLQSIPSNAKVLTHNNFIPQLCNREFIYQFDYNTQHSKLDFAKRYEADYVIGDMAFWEPGTPTPAETIKEFLAAGYQLSFEKDGFFILKR